MGRADAKAIHLWPILAKWIFLPFNIHVFFFSISIVGELKKEGNVCTSAHIACAVLVELMQAYAESYDRR